MSRYTAHRNAQAIVGAQSILKQYFSLELAVGRWLHQLPIYDGDVPARELLGWHRKLAGSKEPSFSFLWRGMQRAKRITHVADRIGLPELFLINIGDAFHRKRREHLFAQKPKQRHSAGLFNDDSGDDI